MWCPTLNGKSGPKYLSIAEAIGESLADGSLSEGCRLPAQRDLAYELGISLNTVSRAYAEAVRRGFVHGEVGRGTYVRAAGPLPAHTQRAGMQRPADGPVDFTLNLPAAGDGAAALAHTLGTLRSASALESFLDYQTGGGIARHAAAGARWIGQLGLDADEGNIVLTNGAQHGLLASIMAATRPGDVVLTESMTYAPVKAIAAHLGRKLFPVAMDEEGLSPEALELACTGSSARTLYCLPTLHTPTTATMSEGRRRDIAAIARRHDLTIIEDDVFGFLPPERPPPIAHFAPERTLFVTSVSKCLAPGLRVGYVLAPERLSGSLRAMVNLSCWMPPPLMAEIASRWIEDGTARRLNEFQRSEAQHRQSMARRILGARCRNNEPCGFHEWLLLPPYWRADAFRRAAEERGVKLLTAETFAVEGSTPPNAIRLCLSHETTRERVVHGLEIIARLFDEETDMADLVV